MSYYAFSFREKLKEEEELRKKKTFLDAKYTSMHGNIVHGLTDDLIELSKTETLSHSAYMQHVDNDD